MKCSRCWKSRAQPKCVNHNYDHEWNCAQQSPSAAFAVPLLQSVTFSTVSSTSAHLQTAWWQEPETPELLFQMLCCMRACQPLNARTSCGNAMKKRSKNYPERASEGSKKSAPSGVRQEHAKALGVSTSPCSIYPTPICSSVSANVHWVLQAKSAFGEAKSEGCLLLRI